jgi:hypothetical protein
VLPFRLLKFRIHSRHLEARYVRIVTHQRPVGTDRWASGLSAYASQMTE